ncbi:MAG TPA: hypothetical protein VFH51_20615, partial [Myxococcota bacterium]|nr:hypothetical protein [Myxococcota bacterium]
MKIAHVCTPLFAVLLGASVAHAADAASAADPLDALSAFEGKWRCQATHVGLFTDSGTLPTRPTSDDPNAAHGHVFAKRVLNKKWLAIAFFDKHGGDTGGSGDGGDTSTPPQNPETTPSDPGDDLFFSHHGHHHHPSSVSLMGYDAPQHHYVSFAFMNSGAYGVATSDGVTDAGMEWSGAVNDWEGQKVYFRKTLTFSS